MRSILFAALKSWATEYLLKGTRRADLLAAIAQIRDGGSPMTGGIARKVVQSFSQSLSPFPGASRLSPREHEVLVLLTEGYLYKEIAESLRVSVPTVDTYIRSIYEKLQVNSRSQAVSKFLQSTP